MIPLSIGFGHCCVAVIEKTPSTTVEAQLLSMRRDVNTAVNTILTHGYNMLIFFNCCAPPVYR